MPLNSPLENFYIKTTPGMNNKAEDLELGGKFVQKAQNCRFEDEPGAVTKRPPVSYYNTNSLGAGQIVGLYRYYGKAGNIKTIIVWYDSTTGVDKVYVGDDTGGAPTLIRTLTSAQKQMAFVTYTDYVIGSNGTDNIFMYDGSSDNVTWELGACKAVLTAGGDQLDASAAYSYMVTFDNGAYICGAVSNTVTTAAAGGTRKVTLSQIPFGPAGAGVRKVFRTEGGGSTYKLLVTDGDGGFAATATTYEDNIPDSSLGATVGSVTDDMPKGSILTLHRERLFVSGDPNYPNRIYYSNPYMPHYIQQTTNTDYMSIAADDGDEIMGIPIQMGTMLCVKKQTIRKLIISSATGGADPTTWYAEDPVAFLGTPAQWSLYQTPYGLVFLGWDAWYLFDGLKPVRIIDQFDTFKILPAMYSSVVTHWAKGILYAAYADIETATKYNNRVMVYNFARDAFAYDTLNVNAFCSNEGDDESGDLFYGDSTVGRVYKAEESEQFYRLTSKTQCSAGTSVDTYVGGTESSPYIEVGSSTAAAAIPDDMCILWEEEDSTPGAGWTEVTFTGLVRLDNVNAAGTTGGTASHTHTFTGTTDTYGTLAPHGGINVLDGSNTAHSHTLSGTSDNGAAYPKYVKFRVFKKNATTTEYVFPVGAVVMWDQVTAPEGWYVMDSSLVGCYIMNGTTDLGVAQVPTHSHTFSCNTSAYDQAHQLGSGDNNCVQDHHTHPVSGTTDSTDMSSWDLANVSFVFIKKVGEEETWDGVDKYVYTLYYSAVDPAANGWTDVTSTYTATFLKISAAVPATGAASGAAHVHTFGGGTTGQGTPVTGNATQVDHTGIQLHTHQYSATFASTAAPTPPYMNFHIAKKILGKMLAYNAAILVHEGTGTWTSPSMEINASTLKNMYWNSTLVSGDTITLFTRTAATQALVEAATAIGTVDHTTDKFTQAGHGLSNGNRIVIGGTAVPTGLDGGRVYFVVGMSGNDFQVSTTSGGSAAPFSANGTAVTFKKWDSALTVSNSPIASTASVWFQYLIAFTAADTTADIPRVSMSDGFVVKFGYIKKGTVAETAVEFVYNTGYTHFDNPMADKIFKKIITYHAAEQGYMKVKWETENELNEFTIDLSVRKARWDSFFPSTAMGRKIKFEVYKNDLYDLTLKEIQGIYTPEPLIL